MECYARFMPELLYYLAGFAQLAGPCASVAFAIFIMATVDNASLAMPFLVFACLLNAGIFLSYMRTYSVTFK